MKKSLKQLEGWVIAFARKMKLDVFIAARFRVIFLYLLMAAIIVAAAIYVIHLQVTTIVQNVLQAVWQLLQDRTPVDPAATANSIIHNINGEVSRTNILVGSWLLLIVLISAYVLADITLRPIKKAMQKQKRFTANVSHELRTPLAVMKMNSELALRNPEKMTQAEWEEALRSNLEEVDRMTAITQFLLNFSGVENSMNKTSFSKVDLSQIITKVVTSLQSVANPKHVLLSFVQGSPAVIRGNAVALEEMLVNLVRNAIKYTPEGGSVRVTLSEKSYGVYLMAIHDTGIGISPDDLSKIFEPFYRASNRIGKENIGLGLAIVKEIVDLHRAKISIKSSVGQGTTVIVKFPAIGAS